MKDEIRREQEKFVKHLKELNEDERKKQFYGLLCWLQGFEAGRTKRETDGKTADG